MRACIIKINQLGDSVVGLPMLSELIQEIGSEQLFVLTTPIASGLYEGIIPMENIFVMERARFNSAWKNPLIFAKIWQFILRARVDYLFIPFDQGNVARLIGSLIPCRGRFCMSNPQVKFNGLGFSIVPFNASLNMHQNNWNLWKESSKKIGFGASHTEAPAPTGCLLSDRQERKELSQDPFQGRRVVIHPGSSRASTQWAFSDFVTLANSLLEDGYRVSWMLEGERPEELSKAVRVLPRTSLREFIRGFGDFDIFVGNNSGPMHLADVLNLRLVVIPGPAAIGWDPYWAKEKRLLRVTNLPCQPCEVLGTAKRPCYLSSEPYACQSRISVEMVRDAVREIAAV